MVALVHIKITRAKQHSKKREPRGDPKRRGLAVSQGGARIAWPSRCKRRKRQRDRLQLKRNIWCGPCNSHQGDHHSKCIGFPKAVGNKICNRSDPLRTAHSHQLAQHPPPANHHKARANIDRQIFKPRARSKPDCPVKCPGGTVDRKRKRVDNRRLKPAPPPTLGGPLGHKCNKKQERRIGRANER